MIFNPVYGGASAPNLGTKTITANGTYQASTDNLDGYDEVIANVPNTYAAADEGKVVSNGALVSQGSATYTSNNTYDTTLINSVTVNVSGGGGATLITKTITANGTYNASDDSADGYSQVTVAVPTNDPFPTLPSDYQRAEYIECNGNQSAETSSVTIASGKAIRIIMASAGTGEMAIFAFTGSGGTTFDCYTSGSNCPALGYGSSPLQNAYSGSLLNVKQFAIWKANASLAKSYIAQYRTSGNRYRYNGKIYRITVSDSFSLDWYDNGTIDYDFIPCYRKADSVAGFYEVSTDTFYPSDSGTAFVAGPDA